MTDSHQSTAQVLDMIRDGYFSPAAPAAFADVVTMLLHQDRSLAPSFLLILFPTRFLTLADYAAYVAAQELVSATYRAPAVWAAKVVANIAAAGKFSSDRTIAEYGREIWGVEPTWGKVKGKGEGGI